MGQIEWAVCRNCGRYPGLGKKECPWCGVVFHKLRALSDAEDVGDTARSDSRAEYRRLLGDLLLGENRPVNPLVFAGRALTLGGLAIWSVSFLSSPLSENAAGSSFLHGVNLLFHEAGHVIFSLLGDFPGVLGGSLAQILMPLICLAAFLGSERETFGASVTFWWTSENLLDLAPYVNDARDQVLPLVGGVTGRDVPGYHDWNTILGALGWLDSAHGIALFLHATGVVTMLVSLLWGACVLRRQYRYLEKD